MNWARQGGHFALIGVVQWIADWGVMVTLSQGGVALPFANMAGRAAGATLGFWLNGRYTFLPGRSGPNYRHFARYAILWCVMALLSTGAVTSANFFFGLRAAWLVKPIIDCGLALLSFTASRRWVYR